MLTYPVSLFWMFLACWHTAHLTSSAERLEAQDSDLVSSPPGGSVCRGTPGPAGGRAPGPSPGVAYLSPLTLPDSQDQREMEECELFLRQSPDRELERLIKLVKQNAIIEASFLQIPPEKTSFSPYLFPRCDRALISYLNSFQGLSKALKTTRADLFL